MKKALIPILLIFFSIFPALANGLPDADGDGVPDKDELSTYFTDWQKADTDGDGYDDGLELRAGFSPHNPKPIKLDDNDQDADGLKDKMELRFASNMTKADTDGDGVNDGKEIASGTDPTIFGPVKMTKRIDVNLKQQTLSYFLDDVRLGTFPVSTGRPGMETPTGTFKVHNKYPRPWSKPYGLWMPYWLGLNYGKFGIHELPEWPGGIKEGENHLGKPVSHGCIRLGVGPAKTIYDWAEVGTDVSISN